MSVPQTTNEDHAEAIKELLNKFDGWSLESPEVLLLQERSQSERGPGQGQPAEMYVWSNGEGTLDPFDMECSAFDGQLEVDIWIVTLEDGLVGEENRTYKWDTVQFLSEYMNDNEENTPFHRVRPNSENDRRSEHITGTTDHHASVVTVSLRDFRDTGL